MPADRPTRSTVGGPGFAFGPWRGLPHPPGPSCSAASLAARSVLVLFLCFPFASYIGVIGAAAGVVALRDLQPLFNQLRYGEAQKRGDAKATLVLFREAVYLGIQPQLFTDDH